MMIWEDGYISGNGKLDRVLATSHHDLQLEQLFIVHVYCFIFFIPAASLQQNPLQLLITVLNKVDKSKLTQKPPKHMYWG